MPFPAGKNKNRNKIKTKYRMILVVSTGRHYAPLVNESIGFFITFMNAGG